MISNQDKEWIIKKLKAFHKTDDVDWEYELMEHGIQYDKPSDVRAYVEKELKKKEYDDQLMQIMNTCASLKLGDKKYCDDIEKRLNALLKRADKDIPNFSKERSRVILEIRGDLIAIRTDGKRGSARTVMRLMGQRLSKEETEKEKKKK